jgi:hypothetical protein
MRINQWDRTSVKFAARSNAGYPDWRLFGQFEQEIA